MSTPSNDTSRVTIALGASAIAVVLSLVAVFRSPEAPAPAAVAPSSAAPADSEARRALQVAAEERAALALRVTTLEKKLAAAATPTTASASSDEPPAPTSTGSTSATPPAAGFVRYEGLPGDVTVMPAENGSVRGFSSDPAKAGKRLKVKGVRADGTSADVEIPIEKMP